MRKLLIALLFLPSFAFAAGLTVDQGGTGQTTFPSSNVLYMSGNSLRLQSTPTTTASCSGATSCSNFTIFGSSPITISSSASAFANAVSTSSQETATYIPIWTSTNGSPALLSGGTSALSYNSSVLNVTGRIDTGTLNLTEFSGVSTPGAGIGTYYAKDDGYPYYKNSSGADYNLALTGLLSYDAWTHPGVGQSATTSMLFFNGNFFAPNGTTTNATTTGSQYLTYIANAAGSFLATDPTGKVIATTTPTSGGSTSYDAWTHPFPSASATTSLMIFSGGASTTRLAAYTAFFGATATSSFDSAGVLTLISPLAITSGGTGTTTAPVGQLLYGGATAYQSVATTTVTATSPLTFTANPVVIGTSPITVACATCATTAQVFGKSWEIVGSFLQPTTSIPIAVTGTASSTFANGLTAGLSIATPYFVATSTTATSTFFGNAYVKGNLQVDGAFFAPVQLTTSGNATINGTLTVTGQTTLATSLSGLLQAASGVVSAITGTLGQVPYYNGTNTVAATSTITIANSSFVGISSTTPGTLLSVGGSTYLGAGVSSLLTIHAGTINYPISSTSTLPNNLPYAFTFATTTTGTASSTLLRIDTTSGAEKLIFGYGNADVIIGDTGAAANLVFEQNSTIKGQGTGRTLTIGANADILNFTGTGTSTFSGNGINVTTGCVAVNGTCISSSSSGTTLSAIFASSTVGSNVSVVFTGAVNSAPAFSAGTLTLPSNTASIIVEMWGGGAGGGGSADATADNGNAGAGGNTCFASGSTACNAQTTIATSTGSAIGTDGRKAGIPGTGIGGDINLTGGGATSGAYQSNIGVAGGSAPLGGGGGKGTYVSAGTAGGAPGGGGSGAGGPSSVGYSGTGGSSGGYAKKLITSPSGTYSYTVGAGGTAGAAGTGGTVGGAGGKGGIVITVYTH